MKKVWHEESYTSQCYHPPHTVYSHGLAGEVIADNEFALSKEVTSKCNKALKKLNKKETIKCKIKKLSPEELKKHLEKLNKK
jgi:hypothetical protein